MAEPMKEPLTVNAKSNYVVLLVKRSIFLEIFQQI